MKQFIDPGEDYGRTPRRRRHGSNLPAPPSLFDTSDKPPPTPFQIKSPTSIDAAAEIPKETSIMRRSLVLACVKGSPRGLARFQIALALGIPDHWISSSVDALVKMRQIEEHADRTVENPSSGKHCAVLVVIR